LWLQRHDLGGVRPTGPLASPAAPLSHFRCAATPTGNSCSLSTQRPLLHAITAVPLPSRLLLSVPPLLLLLLLLLPVRLPAPDASSQGLGVSHVRLVSWNNTACGLRIHTLLSPVSIHLRAYCTALLQHPLVVRSSSQFTTALS
jgi:hypothetical protein